MSVKKINLKEIDPLNYVKEIHDYRKTIKNPKTHLKFVNEVREAVQREAKKAIQEGPKHCLVAMATGSGKTKVAIDYAKTVNKKQALLVPTEKLRDTNWSEEYKKWKGTTVEKRTEKYCYASANKVQNQDYSLAILDEGHNITENNSMFLKFNNIHKSVLLTATVPDRKKDAKKYRILQDLGYKVVYQLTLDNAVKLGFVAPYQINVIYTELESSKKTIRGGTKKKPFMTTEYATYNWLSKSVKKAMFSPKLDPKFIIMKRMRFIYNLPSKTEAAQHILDKIIPKKDRILIFASSIKQAEKLCPNTFHSKTTDKDYHNFREEKINRMSCVKAINEGHNFEGIDGALIVQLTSKEKDLVQRLGRLIRVRPGHKASVFIIVAKGTQDEKWLEKATENLDASSIRYYPYSQINKIDFYGNK